MTEQKDGTGLGLVEHWTWAGKRGLVNKNTAGALRAACTQVLSIDEDWERADIRSLDIDQTFHRFENLRKHDFTPQSLATYKSRFRKAVESYIDYLDNPRGWKPEIKERHRSPTKSSKPAETKKAAAKRPESISPTEDAGMITYPFPIRAGLMARLTLPRDLKRSEAKRLSSFLESVALEGPPELPGPRST